MSNVKFANDTITESYQSYTTQDKIKEWREARLKALHKIEMMVAVAHGKIAEEETNALRNDSEQIDSDEGDRPRPSQIRESLRELALLCQKTPQTD